MMIDKISISEENGVWVFGHCTESNSKWKKISGLTDKRMRASCCTALRNSSLKWQWSSSRAVPPRKEMKTYRLHALMLQQQENNAAGPMDGWWDIFKWRRKYGKIRVTMTYRTHCVPTYGRSPVEKMLFFIAHNGSQQRKQGAYLWSCRLNLLAIETTRLKRGNTTSCTSCTSFLLKRNQTTRENYRKPVV